MQLPEMNHLVFIEQHKERIREIEHNQLLEAAGLKDADLTAPRKIAGWLGAQMIRWGAKLQTYDTTPTQKHTTIRMHH